MSLMKKAIGGSIHRIREFELEKVNLIDEFDILQIVGEGWFGKILLTEHRSTQTEMVLKALPKAYTGLSDFFREFHYGLHLAAHRNIITTYDVAFETAGFYVFSQEYAPLGDLTSNVTETGLGELHAKRVARQLAAAVHHIHSRELVHRDIKLDNILVFKSDFSRIKLCDFGETRRVNTTVRRHNEWLPYSPPEVLQIDTDETYKALTSHDVWQFGIVLFVCLTGCLPWQKAALDDPRYTRYQNWHNATLNIAKKPKLFQLISSRAQRMFKRLLDPKPEKRPVSVLDANKYLEDRWLAKLGAEKALNGGVDDRDELCPSMYSFHSSVEEKNQLLYTLTTYGIETTVDRAKKKDRIREWIQASAIVEEMEDVESDVNEDIQSNDEDEPPSMQGRHFPERRPSAVSRKSDSPKHVPASKKKRHIKSGERRIPFAPQVAEERETTARFASFPNGDPKLAAKANNGDTRSTGRIENSYSVAPVVNSSRDDLSAVNNNDQNINSTGSTSTSYDESIQTNSNSTLASLQPVATRQSSNGIAPDKTARNKNMPKSPQPPSRKHRSQTAPFPPTASSWGDESRVDSTKRSQSSMPLSSGQPDKMRMAQSPIRNDNQKSSPRRSPPVRPEQLQPVANLHNSTSLATRNEEIHTVSSLESQKMKQNGALSAVGQVEVNLEKSPPKNIQMAPLPNMPSAMTATSHLVMQSLNMLQGINTATAVKTPTTSPMIIPNPTPMSTSNSKVTTPKRVPSQSPNEETTVLTYGKDAYEHYGIAQGAILRIEPIKHNSTNRK